MSEKCNPKYKNLNLIQSFSEQRFATVGLFEQACQNDEWLRQQVESLSYLTPPAVRKRFTPILIDESSSYGYQINNNEVQFSNSTSEEININFQDMGLIDVNKSDCSFESYVDQDGNSQLKAVVPMNETSTLDTSVKDFNQGAGINSYWYVGYDKSKSYQVRPDWIKDDTDTEIPAVCRAQTFTVPAGTVGYLESVSLYIENNGVTNSNWGSPLYIRIFPATVKHVQKTYWDKKTKKSKRYSPAQYEDVSYPKVSNMKKPLATAIYNPTKTTPGFQNFLLDKSVKVGSNTEDTYYAIVISSPLSHYEHCPRIGGWGRNCAVDKYSGGNAFLSENNGKSWVRYGRNDLKVPYKMGKYTPLDFAFQCHIRQYSSGRDITDGAYYYLYLAPIYSNPIISAKINATIEKPSGTSLTFEGSTDGQNWFSLTPTTTKTFSTPSKVLFIRAKMNTTSANITPAIQRLNVNLTTQLPKDMYVRTHFYNPKLSPMLGASLWGRICAPFELIPNDGNSECTVEIIQNKLSTEHFQILNVDDLSEYEFLGLFTADDLGDTTEKRVNYLENHPSILQELKELNIYVKPITLSNIKHLLSFSLGGLNLKNKPAYPIKECLIQPDGDETVVSYGEWYDYTVDYTNDVMVIRDDVLEDIPVGGLMVSYNPVFVDNLSLSEVSTRIDDETGLSEEGLILDYFKEKFIIDHNNVETRKVMLRVVPVDPIKQVILNKGTDNEKELFEDIDYSVNYDAKELVFPINNTDEKSSILNENDTLEVVYTPNLEVTSIALGYVVTRKNTTSQCKIKSNYFEYKV